MRNRDIIKGGTLLKTLKRLYTLTSSTERFIYINVYSACFVRVQFKCMLKVARSRSPARECLLRKTSLTLSSMFRLYETKAGWLYKDVKHVFSELPVLQATPFLVSCYFSPINLFIFQFCFWHWLNLKRFRFHIRTRDSWKGASCMCRI